MSPELAARVQRSVSGRRPGAKQRLSPVVASLRLAGIVLVVALAAFVTHVVQQRAAQLEHDRARLLAQLLQHGKGLTAEDRELPAKVEKAVQLQASLAYGGDWLPEPLRRERTLAELLSLPTLYLRGPLEVLARADGAKKAAPASWADAFVLCLLDPPRERSEKALKAKAKAALSGAAMEAHQHVQRLAPLFAGLPMLSADWQSRIALADSAAQLSGYRSLVEGAPLRAAVEAAKSRQLLLVMDEPGDSKTPAELDGERPHAVRVVLTDLESGDVELRFRKDVDPSWLTAATRAEYAAGVDSCSLALDLRAAIATEPG